jgi:hypothetical protein
MVESVQRDSGAGGVLKRFTKGVLPLGIVCFFLFLIVENPRLNPVATIVDSILSCLVLWFSWSYIKGTRVTKWIGIVLAGYFGLVVTLVAFGVFVQLSGILLVLFLVAIPFLVCDLFFRGPAERRQRSR